jgi:agmatine/peptidylarginine deiminase
MKFILYFFLVIYLLLDIKQLYGYSYQIEESVQHQDYRIVPGKLHHITNNRELPAGEEIVSPAEFNRVNGIYINWYNLFSNTLTNIAREVCEKDTVYVLAANTSLQQNAYSALFSGGVNMAHVEFINFSTSDPWIRDFFPFYIYEDGEKTLVDTWLSSQWSVGNILSPHFGMNLYNAEMTLHHAYFLTDGNGMGFCTTPVLDYNYNLGFTESEIRQNFRDFFGIDSLVVVEPMVWNSHGHLDMFCKLLNDTLFVVAEYASPSDAYGNDYEILNNLADELGTMQNLDGRNFQVERIPMPANNYSNNIVYTYLNSTIVNDKILVPVFGIAEDEIAIQKYAELMPNHEVVAINSSQTISYAGAVHCITNHHYADNPLIILHETIETVSLDSLSQITIKFRVNPKFSDTVASVFFKQESEQNFSEAEAELNSGIWSVTLPSITESFEYYISSSSISGNQIFEANLPLEGTFYVHIENVNSNPTIQVRKFGQLKNYPNPFNPETTIMFETGEAGTVQITIFNAKGQKVKILVNERLDPGQHSFHWQGRNDNDKPVASGVYFYHVLVNNTEKVNKMIMLK